MIRLITASPGSGKTCIVVEWLTKEVDKGFYKEFYTNIADLRITGLKPLPTDADWRTLNLDKDPKQPPKLVIIDEAQYFDAFMKENRNKDNAIGKDLSTHRHYGLDIWFITQSTKLLNDYVLENVGEHVHMFRPRKKKNVKVYWWSFCQRSLSKTAFKEADDVQTWRLNPAMFELYKSTSQVTDSKVRTSQKMVSTLVTGVGVLMFLGYMVSGGIGSFNHMHKPDNTTIAGVKGDDLIPTHEYEENPTASNFSASTATENTQLELNRVASVIASDTSCTARNSSGHVISLSHDECMQYAVGQIKLQPSFVVPDITFNHFAKDSHSDFKTSL